MDNPFEALIPRQASSAPIEADNPFAALIPNGGPATSGGVPMPPPRPAELSPAPQPASSTDLPAIEVQGGGIPLPPPRPSDLDQPAVSVPLPPARPPQADLAALTGAVSAEAPAIDPTQRLVGPDTFVAKTGNVLKRSFADTFDASKDDRSIGMLTGEQSQAQFAADQERAAARVVKAKSDLETIKTLAPAPTNSVEAAMRGFDQRIGQGDVPQAQKALDDAIASQKAIADAGPPTMGRARQFLEAAGKATSSVAVEAVSGLARLPAEAMDEVRTGRLMAGSGPAHDWLNSVSERARTVVKEAFQPELSHSLATKAGEAIGGLAPLIAGGFALKALGLSVGAANALVFAGQNGESQYQAAREAGKPDDAWTAYLAGAGIGAAASLPFSHMLSKLDAAANGGLTTIVRQLTATSGEQAANGYVMTLANNLTAQKLYDPSRELTAGAAEAAITQALIGAALHGGSAIVGKVLPGNEQGSAPPRELTEDEKKTIRDFFRSPTEKAADSFTSAPARALTEPLMLPAPGAATPETRVEQSVPPAGGDARAPGPDAAPPSLSEGEVGPAAAEAARAVPDDARSASAPPAVDQPVPGPAQPSEVRPRALTPKEEGDTRLLIGAGYARDQIDDMSRRERAAAIRDAQDAGTEPFKGSLDVPEAGTSPQNADNPFADLVPKAANAPSAPVAENPFAALVPSKEPVAAGEDKHSGQVNGNVNAERDTGQNIPETPATLKAQREQLEAGERTAIMYPEGTRVPGPPPAGMERVETPRGIFDIDPAKVSADDVRAASAAGRENDILGLGPYSKDDITARAAATGEQPVSVVERKPDGTEVRAALGLPSTATEQTAALEKGKTPGNTVAIEPLADTLAARKPEGKRSAPLPKSLIPFLASRGGLAPHGDLTAMDLGRHFVPGHGRLIRKTGMTLDKAREAAVEAGYLHDVSDDAGTNLRAGSGASRTTEADILDAIDREHRGTKIYRTADLNAVLDRKGKADEADPARQEHEARTAILSFLDEIGIPERHAPEVDIARATELVREGKSPEAAFEQAIDEAMRSDKPFATRAAEEHIDLPGWDDVEENDTRREASPREDRGGREREREDGPRAQEAHEGSVDQPTRAGSSSGEEGRGGRERGDLEGTGERARREIATEPGADGKPQTVIPGAERIGDGAVAQRKTDAGLKPKAEQKDTDGLALFGDGHKQADLLDATRNSVGKVGTEARTPAQRAAIGAATEIIRRVAGPDVGVRTPDRLTASGESARASGGHDGIEAAGYYDSVEKVVAVSLADGFDPRDTAHHEAFHALQDMGVITKAEKRVLNADRERLRAYVAGRFGFGRSGTRGMPDYEVEAYAYGAYASERDQNVPNAGQGLHIAIRRAFERIRELFQRIRNALRGLGMTRAQDIFERARTGEMKDRAANGERPADGLHYKVVAERKPEGPSALDRWNEQIRERLASVFDKVKHGTQDLHHEARLLQRELEARRGAPFGDMQDFMSKRRLYKGRETTVTTDFDKEHLAPILNEMRAAGLNGREVGDYLYALHAPERNAAIDDINPEMAGRGSGMSNEEATAILAKAEAGGKREALDRVADMAQGVRRFEIEVREAAGLIGEETAEALRNGYQHYVPLRGFEVGDTEDAGTPSGRKASVRGKEWQQALGRRSKADNPLVNLFDQTYRAITRAELNRVATSTALALRSLGPENVADMVRFDKGAPKREINPATGLVRWIDSSPLADSRRAVGYKVGGKNHYLVFEDEKLAEAVRRLSPDQLGAIGQTILNVTNHLKSLWTHYSPDFLLRHFIFRYPIEAALNSMELPEKLGVEGFGNRSAMRARMVADMVPFAGRASRAIFAVKRGQDGGEYGRYYEEMRAHGGEVGFKEQRDIETIAKLVDKNLSDLSGTPLAVLRRRLRAMSHALEFVTNTLDNSLRLASYVQARKAGWSPAKASVEARDATVDYQLKGQWANKIGLIFPFGNVAIQTGARLTGALARSKAMRITFGSVMLAGFVSSMFNYLIGGDDEDGVPFFDKIPDWDRRMNFILLNPFDKDDKGRPQPIKIPMPYNYAAPLTFGQAFGNLIWGHEGTRKVMGMVAKSTIELFTPIGGEDNPWAMFAPELARPFIHVRTNESWNGAPIHSRSGFQKGPASENGSPNTGDGWKMAARALNAVSGGTQGRAGALDYYPEDVRHVVDSWIGTQRRLIERTANAATDIAAGKSPKPGDVTFERVVRGTDYDMADRSRFYEEREKARAAKEEVDVLTKKGDVAGAEKAVKANEEDLRNAKIFGEPKAKSSIDGRRKALSDSRRAIAADTSMSAADKRKVLGEIDGADQQIIRSTLKALKPEARH